MSVPLLCTRTHTIVTRRFCMRTAICPRCANRAKNLAEVHRISIDNRRCCMKSVLSTFCPLLQPVVFSMRRFRHGVGHACFLSVHPPRRHCKHNFIGATMRMEIAISCFSVPPPAADQSSFMLRTQKAEIQDDCLVGRSACRKWRPIAAVECFGMTRLSNPSHFPTRCVEPLRNQ